MKPALKKPQLIVPGYATVIVALGGWYAKTKHLAALLLLAVVLLSAVWFGSAWLVKRWNKRRQSKFDAGVAAREGIADRKREWQSWTEELDKQGIDRYEKPFFLLVGEPQSGKSVLLQNSDLHFPFGQNRLSGIGGTRGCDWWFTDEGVVLDLAGRLFTHEGGESDEQEWEAFLDLLASYRPMAPANGIMLVIPCDSLLADDKAELTRKANQIQGALVTLTNKLQAQLPIYVILTKADRIFGFAETVHRLDADRRNGMFGWSRDAQHFEEPFDIVEVREAFGEVVERARLLRETMLSSLRLPEGLTEADRMYAFPDELEGLLAPLELYLKKIFSESRLVDRLFFRGFYLTSGLQTGAPIAKVCAEALGGAGEADKRNLEALFSKQQAYFIKDLIRRRVFSEIGLVRPTAGRIKRARRNAWLGYGAAGLFAVAGVGLCADYLIRGHGRESLSAFEQGIARARSVAEAPRPGLEEVLQALEAVHAAAEQDDTLLEQMNTGRQESFQQLYAKVFERRLVPAVRREVEARLHQLVKAAPADAPGQASHATAVVATLGVLELGSAAFSAAADAPATPTRRALALLTEPQRKGLAVAVARYESPGPDRTAAEAPVSSPARGADGALASEDLRAAVELVESRWEGLFALQGAPILGGAARYLMAWRAVEDAHARAGAVTTRAAGVADPKALEEALADYLAAVAVLEEKGLTSTDGRSQPQKLTLEEQRFDAELNQVQAAREALRIAVHGEAGRREAEDWEALRELRDFAGRRFAAAGETAGARTLAVPTEGLQGLLSAPMRAVARPWGADSPSTPEQIVAYLEARRAELGDPPRDPVPFAVLRARAKDLEARHRNATSNWQSLAPDGAGIRASLGDVLAEAQRVRAAVLWLDATAAPGAAGAFADWAAHAGRLASGALAAAQAAVAEWTPATFVGREQLLDAGLLAAVDGLVAFGAESQEAKAGKRLVEAHVRAVGEALASAWAQPGADGVAALVHLDAFLTESARRGVPVDRAWVEAVDEALAMRFKDHADELTAFIESKLPSAALQLESLATRVGEDAGTPAFGRWQKELDDAGVRDVADAAALAPAVNEGVQDYQERLAQGAETWSLLGAALREVHAFAASARRIQRANQAPFAAPLATFVGGAKVRNVAPAALVAVVRTWRQEIAGLVDAAPSSAYDTFLRRLGERLEAAALVHLNHEYVKELAELMNATQFKELARILLESGPGDVPTDTQGLERLHGGLDAMFGKGGQYLALRDKFRLVEGPPALGFEDRQYVSAPEDESWWAVDRFLSGLVAFLRGADGKAEGRSDWKVFVRFDVPEAATEEQNLWTQTTLGFCFTSLHDESLSSFLPQPIEPGVLAPVEAWTVARGGKPIVFRWSRGATGEPRPGEPRIELHSFLAPMLLAWSFGAADAPDPGGAAQRWTTNLPLPAAIGTTYGATLPLVVEFDRKLPPRPLTSPLPPR